jgi:hypothetical protein
MENGIRSKVLSLSHPLGSLSITMSELLFLRILRERMEEEREEGGGGERRRRRRRRRRGREEENE